MAAFKRIPLRVPAGMNEQVYKLALLGMLCALAVIGRLVFNFLPNIQPVTALLILTAIYIGVPSSVLCAVVVVIITNLILGWGPWSFYQIAAWSAIAVISLLFRRWANPVVLVIWAVAAGFLFGLIVSVWSWNDYTPGGANIGFFVYWIAGLRFDIQHAVGNAVFIWVILPLFKRFTCAQEP